MTIVVPKGEMMVTTNTLTYRDALYGALRDEMVRDERVVLLGEDFNNGGAFGVVGDLPERFGRGRVIRTPISENGFVGVAVGAAMTGLRPVVEIMFMDFLTLAMDQLVNHAAKIHYMYAGQYTVPLVVRTPAGAGRGYGASHSQSLEGWLIQVPGLKVVAPSDPADARGLLMSAIRDDNPVVFVENKLLYAKRGEVAGEGEPIPALALSCWTHMGHRSGRRPTAAVSNSCHDGVAGCWYNPPPALRRRARYGGSSGGA